MKISWQPIETAPLDGREVLTYRKALVTPIAVAFFYDGHWRVAGTPGRMALGNVTHWAPLPPPPRRSRFDYLRVKLWELRERWHERWLRRQKVSYTWPRKTTVREHLQDLAERTVGRRAAEAYRSPPEDLQ